MARTNGAWFIACMGVLAFPARAVEYRLQVANMVYLTVSAYSWPPATYLPGTNTLARLETRIDQMAFAPAALIPSREVHLLDHLGYGGKVPARLSVLLPTRKHRWTTLMWDGNPGDTYTFVVRTEMVAWQEAYFIAANPEDLLRMLSLGDPALLGSVVYTGEPGTLLVVRGDTSLRRTSYPVRSAALQLALLP